MTDLSPRLAQLHFLRRYLLQELAKVDGWIQAEEHREAAARRTPLPVPDWVLGHLRLGKTSRPDGVHLGDCGMAYAPKALTRVQALAALAEGIKACPYCRPDRELGVLEA